MGVEAALIGGLIMTAASTAYSSYSNFQAAGDAKAAANRQAAAEREAAAEQAGLLRDKANRLKSEQRAALAAGGVMLDSGSAGSLLAETDRLAEQDVLAVLKGGERRASSIMDQGNLMADRYQSQAIGGALGGIGSLMSGYSQFQGSQKPATTANLIRTGSIKSGASGQTYNGLSLLGGLS